jgi:hypothetical protein
VLHGAERVLRAGTKTNLLLSLAFLQGTNRLLEDLSSQSHAQGWNATAL